MRIKYHCIESIWATTPRSPRLQCWLIGFISITGRAKKSTTRVGTLAWRMSLPTLESVGAGGTSPKLYACDGTLFRTKRNRNRRVEKPYVTDVRLIRPRLALSPVSLLLLPCSSGRLCTHSLQVRLELRQSCRLTCVVILIPTASCAFPCRRKLSRCKLLVSYKP